MMANLGNTITFFFLLEKLNIINCISFYFWRINCFTWMVRSSIIFIYIWDL